MLYVMEFSYIYKFPCVHGTLIGINTKCGNIFWVIFSRVVLLRLRSMYCVHNPRDEFTPQLVGLTIWDFLFYGLWTRCKCSVYRQTDRLTDRQTGILEFWCNLTSTWCRSLKLSSPSSSLSVKIMLMPMMCPSWFLHRGEICQEQCQDSDGYHQNPQCADYQSNQCY